MRSGIADPLGVVGAPPIEYAFRDGMKREPNDEGDDMDTIDGIDLNSFATGNSVKGLSETNCRDVPTAPGVYVVIRAASGVPPFLPASKAGRFKGLDPSYPEEIVRAAWVHDATVVYIGKGAGRNGLRQRVRQLVQFAYGKDVGHRGGRLLWYIPEWEQLLVRWSVCNGEPADTVKAGLIERFREHYRNRPPYANRISGGTGGLRPALSRRRPWDGGKPLRFAK